MKPLQWIKNTIGNTLGHIKCDITGDTLWREKYTPIFFPVKSNLKLLNKPDKQGIYVLFAKCSFFEEMDKETAIAFLHQLLTLKYKVKLTPRKIVTYNPGLFSMFQQHNRKMPK